MGSRITLDGVYPQNSDRLIRFQLTDEHDAPVPLDDLAALTARLYEVTTGHVFGDDLDGETDLLQTIPARLVESTDEDLGPIIELALSAEEMGIVLSEKASELHRLLVHYTWNGGDRQANIEIDFRVRNLAHVDDLES